MMDKMKAMVYSEYGPPEVLRLRETSIPIPKDNEVLVKVRAASVNSWDWDLLRGKPIFIRMWGLFKPKYHVLGSDIAGTVSEVGENVKYFKPGDEVFGDLCECGWGGFAEYVCAPEKALSLKSSAMTFEEAAAIPQAGVLALQGIYDYGALKSGQKVLINGAGGGVGTFAIQMAKLIGAEVTGVDSANKLDMIRSIGADYVIDYTREDYTRNKQKYDLILDNVVNRSIFDYQRSLNLNGIFVMIGGITSRILQIMILGPLMSKMGSKKIRILAHKPNKDLTTLTKLFEAGEVKPVIDKCFPLSEVPQALSRLGEGKSLGKVIVTM